MTEKKEISEQILSRLEYLKEQDEHLKGNGVPYNVTLYYLNEDFEQTNQRGVHINLNKIPIDIIKGEKNYYLIIQIGRYEVLLMNNETGLCTNIDFEDLKRLVKREIVRKKNKKNLTSFFNRLIEIGVPCKVTLYHWYETYNNCNPKSCSETDIHNVPMNRIESDKDYLIKISPSFPESSKCSEYVISTLSNQYDRDLKNFFKGLERDIKNLLSEEYIVNHKRGKVLKDILNDTKPLTLE